LAAGGGAGVTWGAEAMDGDIDVSASYISTNAQSSNPNGGSGGGIGTEDAGNNITAQIAYSRENWGLAYAYSRVSSDDYNGMLSGGKATPLASTLDNIGVSNAHGFSGWWTPDSTGIIPSVSAGFGLNNHDDVDDSNSDYDKASTFSWSIGLEWEDAFVDGNSLGFAFGQATHATDIDFDADRAAAVDGWDFTSDHNFAYEWWYQIQVSDNITVTPAIFYLANPMGEEADTRGKHGDDDDAHFNNLGALVKTTFRF